MGLPGLLIGLILSQAPAFAQSTVNADARAQIPARNPEAARQESGALLEGRGILDRARPEYDALGVPLGASTLFPSLATGISVDDNIYRAPAGTTSAVFTISPRLELRSGWEQDSLQLYGQLDHYHYADQDSESRTNWILGAAGRKDLAPGAFLSGNTYFFDTHETRTSPDLSLLALSPTRYRRLHADGAASRQSGVITLSAAANYDRFDFDRTQLAGGGSIGNGDRNRDVYQLSARAAYEMVPGQMLFLQAIYDRRDFDRLLDRNGLNRDSDGYRLDLGASMMVTPVIRASGYVGLLQQNHAPPLADTSTLDFNLQIDWFATELMTGHFTAARVIDDTTIAGASSVDVQQFGVSLDYELLREVILQPYLRYDDQSFQGIPRNDRIVSAGIEARYLMNGNFALYANYAFQQRDTNAVGRDFSSNVFTVGLRSQL